MELTLRSRCPFVSVVVAALAVVMAPCASARAWTEAQVHSAQADVELHGNGRLHVKMDLVVYVHGGWLEGLDIAGLDPGLTLDETVPIRLVAEDGQTHVPTVRVRPGAGIITLGFRRRGAPRRGEYRVSFAYHADLAPDAIRAEEAGQPVRFEWTLPGWRSGLNDVVVRVTAPPGTTWERDVVTDHALMRHELEETDDGRALLTWRRAHLPRTVSWPVVVHVPEDAVAPSLRSEAVAGPEAPALTSPDPERPRARDVWVLFALFALVAIAKLGAFAHRASGLGLRSRGLIPLPRALRGLLIITASAAGAWAWHIRSDLGLLAMLVCVPLVMERTPTSVAAGKLGGYRLVTLEDRLWAAGRARVEHAHTLRWFDVTRPAGLVVLFLCLLAVSGARAAWPAPEAPGITTPLHGLLVMALMMVFASDAQLPSSVASRLVRLERLGRGFPASLGGVAAGLGLMLHRDGQGAAQDARLRVATDERASGLVRLDITIADRLVFGRYLPEPLVLVVTRAGSPAEEALRRALPEHPTLSAPGGRRARSAPLHMLDDIARAVCVAEPAATVEPKRDTPAPAPLTAFASTRA